MRSDNYIPEKRKKKNSLTWCESCLMLSDNLVIHSICSPNCHSFAYFLTFRSSAQSVWRAASPDWHFWWAMGGVRRCQTDSFWQLSTSGHVQSPRPMEGRHPRRGRRCRNAHSSFFSLVVSRSALRVNTDFSCYPSKSWFPFLCVRACSVCVCVCVCACACPCMCARALWTAPSLSYHPHQLLVSCSSPKSSWPSSNKPISCNQELSCPFSYIHFDIYTQAQRHTHTHTNTYTSVNFSCRSFSLPRGLSRRRRSVPESSVASVAMQAPLSHIVPPTNGHILSLLLEELDIWVTRQSLSYRINNVGNTRDISG